MNIRYLYSCDIYYYEHKQEEEDGIGLAYWIEGLGLLVVFMLFRLVVILLGLCWVSCYCCYWSLTLWLLLCALL